MFAGRDLRMLWPQNPKQLVQRANRRRVQRIDEFVRQARAMQKQWSVQSLDELSAHFSQLQHSDDLSQYESLSQYERRFVEATGLILEVVRRLKGFSLHDVQVAGAGAAASGTIIEMQTGEGKTIVCGVAALIRSVFDSSVHVATTNDYLAERDQAENKPLFDALNVSSSVLKQSYNPSQTRSAYRDQITYGPGYLFGFDYLRDQATLRKAEELVLGRDVLQAIHGTDIRQQLSQTVHNTIIIDEADSVLIDEATTPLILSAPNSQISPEGNRDAIKAFLAAKEVGEILEEETHFHIDRVKRQIQLTKSGEQEAYRLVRGTEPMRLEQPWSDYVKNALYAVHFLNRDEHYVVHEGEIRLVDQFTGRILEDRQLRGGLHQAVEASENVAIKPANVVTARLTRQRYFQLYDLVAGMTGTVRGNESEIEHFYSVKTSVFEPNAESKRSEIQPRFFASWQAKLKAIVLDVAELHRGGRPVLIGTRTILESRLVEAELQNSGLSCIVLNGIQDASEAEIVAEAGQVGAITVATNMAGRGTDIKLSCKARELGGLHVICTQRHTSQRIDRQLLGRCARQGDPGSFRFYISADDDLFQSHAPELGQKILKRVDSSGETHRDFTAEILNLQSRIEQQQFELRRSLVRHDQWMNEIRESLASPTLPQYSTAP